MTLLLQAKPHFFLVFFGTWVSKGTALDEGAADASMF